MKKQKNFRTGFSLIELSIVILIIGILIAGVTQSSRLITQFKLTTARTLTQSSPATSIKDLLFWFETSSEKSFFDTQPDNLSAIALWNDINPQNISKNNATATDIPTYIQNCVNGLPCVRFNGTSNFMTLDSTVFLKPMTMFIVTKTASIPAQMALLGTSLSGIALNINQTTGTLQLAQQNSAVLGSSTAGIVAGQSYVISVSYDSSGNVAFFSNGTANGTATNDRAIGIQTLAIGYNILGTNLFYNGDIAEIIGFGRLLKTEERKSVEAYLGKKWGIKVS